MFHVEQLFRMTSLSTFLCVWLVVSDVLVPWPLLMLSLERRIQYVPRGTFISHDKPWYIPLCLASCQRSSGSMALVEFFFADKAQYVPRGTSMSNDGLEQIPCLCRAVIGVLVLWHHKLMMFLEEHGGKLLASSSQLSHCIFNAESLALDVPRGIFISHDKSSCISLCLASCY